MRCLLVSSYGVELDALHAILREHDVSVVAASERGAGVTLAKAALDDVDLCVAVLPTDSAAYTTAALAYVEIGVAAARGIPTLVVGPSSQPPVPALYGLPTVGTEMDDIDVLRLHVGLFVRSASGGEARTGRESVNGANAAPAELRDRILDLHGSPGEQRREQLVRLLAEFLRDAGARVELAAEVSSSAQPEDGVEIAALFPADERHLGTVLVGVGGGEMSGEASRAAQESLSRRIPAGGGFGLFVYDDAQGLGEGLRPVPMVHVVSAEHLLSELERTSTYEFLIYARNQAIRGM